ncbi:MAG: phosphoribosylanthranilate isomerase [Spirochaetia bacterium]|jgi:phosphoribosylanthranilate isomerase|nr:phosphoribosylanthranilate isomerase [Spirochaetia bacterium]
MSVRLKICGIRRDEDVGLLNRFLPDYAGFVFASSKRQIDVKTAVRLRSLLDARIRTVGVFVDASLEEVETAVQSGAISMVQLHGNEDESYIQTLKAKCDVPVIKAVRMNGKEEVSLLSFPSASCFLLDSGAGSGQTFDWKKESVTDKPLFIAGGIGSSNLQAAIEFFHPYAVDVSSSVETDGYKDEEKIRKLVETLHRLTGES